MLSSAVRTFSDPDDYAAAIRNTKVEITVTGRGEFNAKLTRIDLHRLWMQRFSDNLPRVADSSGGGGRVVISFRTQPGPSLLWGGSEMQPTNIVRHGADESKFQRSSGSASWGAMSLPVADAVTIGETLGGCDLRPLSSTRMITPPGSAVVSLHRLHAAAGQLAEDAPEIIAHPEAARGLEQALIEALVACLNEGSAGEDRSARRRHAMIMRRFRRAVEENLDQPLYMPELCGTIGVSDRTLRVCCQEQLGVSPKRYLLLRRMNLARQALRDSSPATTTVTEIATQHGFWQFGRFAGEYKSLFGEAPSATLQRPGEELLKQSLISAFLPKVNSRPKN
jgi:AraC-like DNA-binding protein